MTTFMSLFTTHPTKAHTLNYVLYFIKQADMLLACEQIK